LKKSFFGTQKTVVPSGRGKENFFFNFKCYDLTNDKK
jgi:hypothetical protein